MAKQNCTILMDPDDLRDIIQFKIKSVQRAINNDTNTEINKIRQRNIADLTLAVASINQGELPLNKQTK